MRDETRNETFRLEFHRAFSSDNNHRLRRKSENNDNYSSHKYYVGSTERVLGGKLCVLLSFTHVSGRYPDDGNCSSETSVSFYATTSQRTVIFLVFTFEDLQ